MVRIAEEIKQKILNDPILDTRESIQKSQWLIANLATLREDAPILLSDEELAIIESSHSRLDSSFEKVIQAFRNNGVDLTDLINCERKKREIRGNKSQELKERILNSLLDWTVLGGTDGAISNGKESDIRLGDINKEDYQEIKKNIAEAIRQNSSEWTIKSVLVSTGKGMYGYRQEDTLLVHQSFKVRYDEYGQLVIEYGKVHWKSGFNSQQQKELEQLLQNNQQQNDNVAQVEQSLKSWFPFFRNPNSKH